jgi:formylglycine-generating enzyme required for sulfatase activity
VRHFGPARTNYIRDQLDRALDRWWAIGELPPLALLRDGLLLLEAGAPVSESQRTLLLRAALAYGRGVQTALRHQADAERVALVLAEALVEWEVPLEAERLPEIVGHDEPVRSTLLAELERSRILLTGEARRRAIHAIESMPRAASVIPVPVPPIPRAATRPLRRRTRQLLLLLLLAALVGFVLWQQRQVTPREMAAMPAATYALLAPDEQSAAEGVHLEAYFIDLFEATNRDYRTCVERGACAWPVQTSSATRTDYFTNPVFDGYPVVNVTQRMAAAYCAWQGKRLPTEAEWQAAASVSTTTGQAFRYPWGATLELQRTNGGGGSGDTVAVGSFRPAGDSPNGASDFAGNVAEWTATLVQGAGGDEQAVVKGGSFASEVELLSVAAQILLGVDQATPEVGFRCARSHLRPES